MILRLVLVRIGTSVATLLAVSMLVFVAVELLPGDVALRILGQFSTAEQRQLFRQRLRLDLPPPVRYAEWLLHAVRGDFGYSLANQRPVSSVVLDRLRGTVLLALYALVLYVPVTLVLAVLGAVYRGRAVDALVSVITLISFSLPEFVTGPLLIIVFAVGMSWFPAMSLIQQAKNPLEFIQAATLPAVALTLRMAAYGIRMLRENLIEVLGSDYVNMAILHGLPRYRVVLRHALPNALGPALNITAINLAYAIGGVVVVESVFAYPGLGRLLVDALTLRDVPVIEASILLIAAVYILGNLAADLGSLLLNPRLRARR
jgi:peptide/nickel transport system permease protein